MPRKEKYVPKHRNAPLEPAIKKGARKSFVYSGVAVAATGIAVSSSLAASDQAPVDTAASTIATAKEERKDKPPSADLVNERERETASRSDRRPVLDKDKKQALAEQSGGMVTKTEDLSEQDPREIARQLLPKYGFSSSEFSCLDALYVSESDWDMHADNPTSSAYGIPQALTSTHELPSDYASNPVSQIEWGLDYIRSSYGTPCSAWEFKQANNWY
ncbi:MAG: lytic transglycosylase domain-containing protein [Actinomycetes bacterium]